MARPLIQIVYNASSGGYAPARIDALRAAFEARGARVRLSPTGKEPIAIDAEAQGLCIAGGDGTVRHAAHALLRAGRAIPIGIYPTGTINLLSREAGLDSAAGPLAERLLGTGHRACYAVTLDDTMFLACASVGPETWAVGRVSLRLKRRIGRFAYAVALVPFLARWPRIPIRLDIAGRMIACEAFYVAKGRYFAGGWVLSSSARLGAPDMQLVILRTARRRDMARFWARLLVRRPVGDLPFVETIACTAFEASADSPLGVQADGDIAASLPASFAVIPTPFAIA